ncbi:cell wall-active antibiotics response protein LiaF [Lapidilactobacillus luobeiensis]|uniref:cell wall-active antibiotics response protein LiaF n=1 Tax=Lapidilactobacillus luobeiensis TaxID=2950371 RepID=UPI0021C298F3|nr:cell wall-active antibiotics response protein LiaF [Lapidilactobacillus luobeiensis]
MRKFLPFMGVILVATLIMLGWQIFSTPQSIVFLILGILLALIVNRRQQRGKQRNSVLKVAATISIVVSVASHQSFWLFLFLTLLFLILITSSSLSKPDRFFWQRKNYTAPQVDPDLSQGEQSKDWQMSTNRWWGDQNIGKQVYQWQDINLKELGGDTIIDLGNTLLPTDRENVVILQKGFGNTRVLVPFGTAVYLEHSVFVGDVKFADQRHQLKNQTFRVKTPDYQSSERRIRIVTSCLIGDLEVVYV